MTPQEQSDKLSQIPTLTRGELIGWHALISGSKPFCRSPFPGEMAAILGRAKQLDLTLSHPDPSVSATGMPS